MRRFAIACLFVLGLLSVASAQSGRKIAPTQTPVVKTDTAPQYSESKPQPKRPVPVYPTMRGNSNSKPKDVTKGSPTTVQTVVANDEEAVKIETNLITIPVSVFDRNGLYIPNLQQQEFKIFEDGVEQEIAYFGSTDKPFTVVLLLDVSISTQYKIEEIRSAAKAFIDQLKMQDRVIVVQFDERVKVLAELTGDRQQIYRGIDRADFGPGTSLYDAVDLSLRKYLKGIEGRKAIVLFTDGVDTTSERASYDTTLDFAEEFDALIFPIYYNTFLDNRRGQPQWPQSNWPFPQQVARGTSAREYALGKKYVDELAAYTGGRVFRPEATPGGLTAAFEGIAEELRRQYNIGYVPKADGTPGQRKLIKVRVSRPNLVLRARDSYIVGVGTQASTSKPNN